MYQSTVGLKKEMTKPKGVERIHIRFSPAIKKNKISYKMEKLLTNHDSFSLYAFLGKITPVTL